MRAKAWRMLFAGRRWMLWLPRAGVGMAGTARMAAHPRHAVRRPDCVDSLLARVVAQ